MINNSSAGSKVNKKFNLALVLAAFCATIFLVVSSIYVQEGFDLQIGGVSPKKIKAERKVENKVATERNHKAAVEAADKLEPITERDDTVNDKVKSNIGNFFRNIDTFREAREQIANQTSYDEDGIPETPTPTPSPAPVDVGIPLTASLTELLLSMDVKTYDSFSDKVYEAVDIVLEKGIREIDTKSLLSVKDDIDKLDLVADMKTLCYEIISAYIVPNIIINVEATIAAKEKRASEYETVNYLKDQTIVDEGQIINEEQFVTLELLGLVRGSFKDNIIPIVGVSALVAVLFVLISMYILNFYRRIATARKEALLLFTLYILVIFFTFILVSVSYYFVPILVFTILVSVLVDERLAIVLNMCVTIICSLIHNGNMEFLLFFMLVGTSMALISTFTTERNKIILVGMFGSLLNLAIVIAISFVFEKRYSPEMVYSGLFAAGAGIISVILAIGSLPIWEGVFGVVTPIKLLDLSNPNSPLLRRLTIEAPGTYHHSLIVANLAETAAFNIGANPSLARVGAYYHDIGKLKYPNYFSENQAGENLHDDMDPYSSVQVLISHVAYGLELADTYKLPKDVKDIISEHHGNTLIKYFYYKAQRLTNSSDIEEKDFRYLFRTPQSKEAAIVMMADTVEAAVRSMLPSGKDLSEIEAFARELVKDKQDDGQLTDSSLTLKDIDTIIKSFMQVFKGMYHARIPYPKREDGKGHQAETAKESSGDKQK